jgi:hypothetical protein
MIFCFTLLEVSCGLQYIDKPQPFEWETWAKQDVTPWQVKQELIQCGASFNYNGWSIKKQIDIDNCMLAKGFIFIDSPYGDFGAICNSPKYKNILPSCLSMKRSK